MISAKLSTATIALCLGAAVGAAALSTVAMAQETPQAKREQMMKQVGGAVGALGAIAKGQKPYDAEAVKTALTTISTDMKAFPDQFPAAPKPIPRRQRRSGRTMRISAPMRPSLPVRPTRFSPRCRPIRQACRKPSRRSAPIAAPATRPIASRSDDSCLCPSAALFGLSTDRDHLLPCGRHGEEHEGWARCGLKFWVPAS